MIDPFIPAPFILTSYNVLTIGKMLDRLIQKSRIQIDQYQVNMPDGSGRYLGCWVRDFTMLCESRSKTITTNFIKQGLDLFFQYQAPSGEVTDWVRTKPKITPIYRLFNHLKFQDNSLWLVRLMGLYLQYSQDWTYFQVHEQQLLQAMAQVDLDPRNNALVFIDPKRITANWGFTDTIQKTGAELFCSLLRFWAAKILSWIYQQIGKEKSQKYWSYESKKITENLDLLYDSKSKLYFAAEYTGRQIDIWGNAFGVYISAFPKGRNEEICRVLFKRRSEFLFEGQVRHLFQGEFWQAAHIGVKRIKKQINTYQNGAYWGTPSAWMAYVFAQIDPQEANRMIDALFDSFVRFGIYECIYPTQRWWKFRRYMKCPDYVASLALPFQTLIQ